VIDEQQPQPTEYDHSYENIDEDEIADRGSSFKIIALVVSAIIALVMVTLPALRVIDWGDDDDDTGTSASEARAYVAARFADDALERRSAISASQWAMPDLRGQIVEIVDSVAARPTEELTGAAVSLARVDCNGSGDDDSECFHAWLRQPNEADLIRVKLTVRIVNGNARVTEIERVGVV
jgi:hypothetical protein